MCEHADLRVTAERLGEVCGQRQISGLELRGLEKCVNKGRSQGYS